MLQEFYVNIRRKVRPPVSLDEARALVSDYLAWEPIANDGATVLEAIDAGGLVILLYESTSFGGHARNAVPGSAGILPA